ncbi:hypothetical protein SAMN05443247_03116 [Bradyrhizobium erythrophlei]|nr:hypothetical protein SAMN05443247_03116 [Bradyrhizobium erythrophlei]
MSDDDFLDDDLGDNFFASGDETPKEDRPLGLVIPHLARIILDAKGAIVWDELAEMERAYRARGRRPIIFEEEAAED